ncbi:CAMK family protein kinase [Tritrichomonas foetus]|uniref:CAMK family protein kinase n=1 Tax=Tritrichomonas foetus TaxID=1144522 RepID=A0A1J4JKW9_9EUKA|nr:CAMK family protein kinase [Tritrichomonas foetus]|eukprot:OHS99738.1 CAMK family protein kinase [Tritrichomonas foetus]
MEASFDPFPILPVQVRQYELVQFLGRGGFGVVFKAINTIYGIEFAIKVMAAPSAKSMDSGDNSTKNKKAPKDEFTDGFKKPSNEELAQKAIESWNREVETLIKLDHPNVIRIYDHFEEDSKLFLVLEYCNGGSLEEKIIQSEGRISIEDQISYCSQIVSALRYCHQNSIAHRDIKTANILFDSHGRIKIVDFGLSLRCEKNDKLQNFSGSYLYMAPEILKKVKYDPYLADIWALGVLFYRVASAKYPWCSGNRVETTRSIVNAQYNYLTGNPLMKVIKQMLDVIPEHRITIEKLAEMDIFRAKPVAPNITLIRRNSKTTFAVNVAQTLTLTRANSGTSSTNLLKGRRNSIINTLKRVDSHSPIGSSGLLSPVKFPTFETENVNPLSTCFE